MRAVVCPEPGGPEKLRVEEVPDVAPAAGEVRLEVRAAGVNFADVLMVAGTYQSKPPLPFSPGMEAAGVVVDTGPDVTSVRAGDRVLAVVPYGAFAERLLAPAASVRKLPESLGFEAAAGFAVAYGTAHLALWHRGRLAPGETLLVTGAAGGVGLAAIEVGRALGARVVAVVSNEAKGLVAAEHGAEHVIDLSKTELRAGIRAVTDGAGVDVVLDNVGGELFEPCLRSLRWNGRLLVVGFASGNIPRAPANLALVKNASIVGVFWGAYFVSEPATIQRSFDELFRLQAEGRFQPRVTATLPFGRAGEALALLRDRKATGKVVLVP